MKTDTILLVILGQNASATLLIVNLLSDYSTGRPGRDIRQY